MSARDFAQRVSAYLGQYLPGQRNLSPNTIASYRDMFKLLVTYFGERGRKPERMSMDDLTRGEVEGYMAWLAARGCSDSTVNQRLCAIKAFVNYVKVEDPARMFQYQRVLAIRQRKKEACWPPSCATPIRAPRRAGATWCCSRCSMTAALACPSSVA